MTCEVPAYTNLQQDKDRSAQERLVEGPLLVVVSPAAADSVPTPYVAPAHRSI
jgi:hypothetical protein